MKPTLNPLPIDKLIFIVYFTIMTAIGVEGADRPVDKNLISSPSSELRHRTIATFPLPVAGDIEFKVPINEFDEGYESDCKKRGVIPHSTVEIDLAEREKTYTKVQSGRHTRRQALLFLAGGKPSRIKINLGSGGLEYLNMAIRPSLHDDGYRVTDAQLAISTQYQRDSEMSMEGHFLDTGVTISPEQIKLEIGKKCTNEQREVLTKWFSSLQEESSTQK